MVSPSCSTVLTTFWLFGKHSSNEGIVRKAWADLASRFAPWPRGARSSCFSGDASLFVYPTRDTTEVSLLPKPVLGVARADERPIPAEGLVLTAPAALDVAIVAIASAPLPVPLALPLWSLNRRVCLALA